MVRSFMQKILRRLSKPAISVAGQPARRRTPKAGYRPRLEALEDRTAPATFTVTTNADAGAGSLRAAVDAANNEALNLGADNIVFNLPAGQEIIGLSGND